MEKEVTYYRFYSNVRKFIEDLRDKPLKAEPSEFLKAEGFTKDSLILTLIKRGMLRRKENIDNPSGKDSGKPTYRIRYTVIGDGIEDKIEKMYKEKYKTKKMNEEGEGAAVSSGCDSGGATSADGSGQYVAPINGGKPIRRRIFVTESQMCELLNGSESGEVEESTDCGSVGNYTYDANPFAKSKFFGSAMSRPKGRISVGKAKKKRK